MLMFLTYILIAAIVVGGGVASLTYSVISFFDFPFWLVYAMGGISGIVGAVAMAVYMITRIDWH